MCVGWPTATPPYAGNVTQSGDLTAVLLNVTGGPIRLRPTVLWTGGDAANDQLVGPPQLAIAGRSGRGRQCYLQPD